MQPVEKQSHLPWNDDIVSGRGFFSSQSLLWPHAAAQGLCVALQNGTNCTLPFIYVYKSIFLHSMKSLDSLYCEFVSALVRESDWKKPIIYGICTFWTQKRCIPWQEQMLHIQGITSENIVLSLTKFLISVLWDFLVFILRDLIHSTDYSMVLGEWGPVTAQNCIWNCSFFSLAKASCSWGSVIGSCSLLALWLQILEKSSFCFA